VSGPLLTPPPPLPISLACWLARLLLLLRFIAGRLDEASVSVRLKALVLSEILLREAGDGFRAGCTPAGLTSKIQQTTQFTCEPDPQVRRPWRPFWRRPF
jgi:hypothetical protein